MTRTGSRAVNMLAAIKNRPGSALMFIVGGPVALGLLIVAQFTGPIDVGPEIKPWMILAFWPTLLVTCVWLDDRGKRSKIFADYAASVERNRVNWDQYPPAVIRITDPNIIPEWAGSVHGHAYSKGTVVSAEGSLWCRGESGYAYLSWAEDRRNWRPVVATRWQGDEIEAWTEVWDPSTGEWHELEVQP